MGELLLELLSEEIPAQMQRRAIDDLTGLIRDKLAAADIPAEIRTGHVTPRRLTVIADGIPARQPDRKEERRGPRVGAPEQALNGFLRAAGLTSIDQCEVRGDFYFAVIKRLGRATAEVLPELIHAAMTALSWPKSMRYPASELRWVRPLNSVICLFDGKVLNLPLGEVSVGRVTRGHRFLSKGEISVADAADYREKLAKAHVVLDWNERREIIAKGLGKLAGAEGLTAKPDDGLLDEVAGLVEYPVVLMGSIDADFVRPLPDGLPPEVLATAMRTHQKYFSCLSADGTPAPRFLFVANNVTADKGAAIVAGNERVLRARLSDAKFFWDQDRKVRLEDRVEALKQRVYHEKLGSVYDKTARLTDIANKIAVLVYPLDHELWARAERAAHLAKADLFAGMVGEFPELQGVMGGYYALTSGQPEDHRIATAIANHYKPLGPSDSCPSTPESLVVALADKIETLTGFFRIEEKPTGSRDPFALRRAALGMIRLILENGVRIPLRTAFYYGSSAFDPVRYGIFDLSSELLSFITDRLKVHLREQGIRSELIAATSTWGGLVEDDLVRLVQRVRTLEAFLATDDGENLLTAYRRASSIVEIEERRDDQRYNDAIAPLLFKQPEELNLGRSLEEIGGTAGALLLKERFAEAMRELAKLRRPIDEFFARVTVNTDDVKLRQNRLRLLAGIRTTMKQVADFSQIEG
ncbi:MAG TPA: glycine--tRNA ligase subunit beta [Stellaceae bacterium]|nr:glycine--tRNA ligase subunit beta [Stellaceae bacterium]